MFPVNYQSSFFRPSFLFFFSSSFPLPSFLLDGGLAAHQVAIATVVIVGVVVIIADGAEGWRCRKSAFSRHRLQLASRNVPTDEVGKDPISRTIE